MSLKKGDKVKIIGNGNPVHHFLVIGTEAEFKGESSGQDYYFVGQHVEGETIHQYVSPADFQVIEQPIKAKEKKVTEVKDTPKVKAVHKTLYAVQAVADGEVYTVTEDRNEARAVKAEEGGKAYGVTIVQYKATKEIR